MATTATISNQVTKLTLVLADYCIS